MRRNTEATCGNCPAWQSTGEQNGNQIGECRMDLPKQHLIAIPGGSQKIGPILEQRPPQIVGQTTFPVTQADGWCMQHPESDLDEQEPLETAH